MRRLPTLDDLERRPDGPMRHPQRRDNREPATRGAALGSGTCWCGRPYAHNWPGKDSGDPHPRSNWEAAT